MNVNTLDLNLLRVFNAVMQEGSASGAGDLLGLTQPAVSKALNRLRLQCNDPLFVRTTKGMQPTDFARSLADPIAQALSILKSGLEADIAFDPGTSSRSFTLLMTDLGGLMFLPKLTAYLSATGPGIQLVVRQMPRDQYRDALESGEADLALGLMPMAHKDFFRQSLIEEKLVCLMRRGHPVIKDQLTLQQFMDAAHVCMILPARIEDIVKKALGDKAAERRIALRVPSFSLVPMIVADSDFIAVAPHTIFLEFDKFKDLKFVPLPFETSPLVANQFWHKRSHRDPGHAWLRAAIASLFCK